MKIVTIILIILFASAVIFFSVMFIQKSVNDKKITSEKTLESKSGTIAVGAETTEEAVETSTSETTIETTGETTNEPSENITDIEIYLDGDKTTGIFLGHAKPNLPSEDAETIYGKDFANSGFSLKIENKNFIFDPGATNNIFIYTYIPALGWEYTRIEAAVPGDANTVASIRMSLDTIEDNSIISQSSLKKLKISGWAVDTNVSGNTGINKIEVYLDGPRNMGKLLGEAKYGLERTDVGNALNNTNYNNSGYSLSFDARTLEAGSTHKIYVYAYASGGTFQYISKNITIEGETKELNSTVSANVNFGNGFIEITGWAISIKSLENLSPPAINENYEVKKIVFVSNKSGNEDIFSINLDGSELTQLTNDPGSDQYPVVSPDGNKIAYVSDVAGVWQIMVMDWDGKNKKQITFDHARHGYLTWSFDGKYIFYGLFSDDDWELYRMNNDGSNIKRLTFDPGKYDWHPSAHPFEYKVLFEVGSSGEGGINIIDYDGKNLQRITKPGKNFRVPKMSPDGKKIACMGFSGNDKPDVYIMDSNGDNIIKLTDTSENAGIPCFSPDNKLIAYDQTIDGSVEIFIMDIDGSNKTRITNIPGDDWGPSFLYQGVKTTQ